MIICEIIVHLFGHSAKFKKLKMLLLTDFAAGYHFTTKKKIKLCIIEADRSVFSLLKFDSVSRILEPFGMLPVVVG